MTKNKERMNNVVYLTEDKFSSQTTEITNLFPRVFSFSNKTAEAGDGHTCLVLGCARLLSKAPGNS